MEFPAEGRGRTLADKIFVNPCPNIINYLGRSMYVLRIPTTRTVNSSNTFDIISHLAINSDHATFCET